MGRHEPGRRSLAIELQTSASLVDAALRLLSEHWSELTDERRRQVLAAAWERAHHVAMRLDETVDPDGTSTGPEQQAPDALHEVE
jgi:hypothetical protein